VSGDISRTGKKPQFTSHATSHLPVLSHGPVNTAESSSCAYAQHACVEPKGSGVTSPFQTVSAKIVFAVARCNGVGHCSGAGIHEQHRAMHCDWRKLSAMNVAQASKPFVVTSMPQQPHVAVQSAGLGPAT